MAIVTARNRYKVLAPFNLAYISAIFRLWCCILRFILFRCLGLLAW